MEVVVAALAAGASAGVGDVVKGEIVEAWKGLRAGVAAWLGRGRGQRVLEAFEAEPDRTRAELEELLTGAELDDPALVAVARQILAVTDPEGTRAGRYQFVDARGAGHVTVGDTNVDVAGDVGAAGTFNDKVDVTMKAVGLPPTRPAAG
ncbi:hypothetical protein PT931_02650 [Longispora urticae]